MTNFHIILTWELMFVFAFIFYQDFILSLLHILTYFFIFFNPIKYIYDL